ncbi:hypothetical protein KKC1_25610 [Calderihabitans maritimus]|uniref:Uncharacterized protein n=1 Tax=Calderihabitans maritimus TaxID=1246530 RepID=A0A1Z5HVR0_9FIRM|nr:hypothetical protein KKC1_25610 [Calderihabitans maritimus]
MEFRSNGGGEGAPEPQEESAALLLFREA